MGAFPYQPGLIRCIITYSGDRDIAQNSFYLLTTGLGGYTSAELATLAGEIDGPWDVAYIPNMASYGAVAAVECIDMSTDLGASGIYEDGAHGTGSATLVPAQAAIVMDLEEGLRYRGGHPHVMLPLFSYSLLATDQVLSDAGLAELQGAFDTCLTTINEATISGDHVHMVNFHYRAVESEGPPVTYKAPIITNVNSLQIQPVLGTIRRRVRRGERHR